MIPFTRVSLIVSVALMTMVGCNESEQENKIPVYWPGSVKYEEIAHSASITPSNALKIARSYAKTHGEPEVMWPEPLLLIGNGYLFGIPEKDHVRLDGYLIDKDSGEVRRVKSSATITPDDKVVSLENVLSP